jgi:hypothetical protein
METAIEMITFVRRRLIQIIPTEVSGQNALRMDATLGSIAARREEEEQDCIARLIVMAHQLFVNNYSGPRAFFYSLWITSLRSNSSEELFRV